MKETQKHTQIRKAAAQIVTPFSLMHNTQHHLMFCDLGASTAGSLTSLYGRSVFFADSGKAQTSGNDDVTKKLSSEQTTHDDKKTGTKLEQQLEKNKKRFHPTTYSKAHDALKRGTFYEETLVERLIGGTITSERFEEMVERLGKELNDPEKNLTEMELTGKIKSGTYDQAIQSLQEDDEAFIEHKMAARELSKGFMKEKEFLLLLKKKPLPKKEITRLSALETYGNEAIEVGRESTHQLLDAYSTSYEEYCDAKVDTPEMAEEYQKNMEKMRDAAARKDTVGRQLDAVLHEVAEGDQILEKKLSDALFSLLKDEEKVTTAHIQTAFQKVREGSKKQFQIDPQQVQQIEAHFEKIQKIGDEFAAKSKAMTDHLALIQKKSLEKASVDKVIADGQRATGITLKPGTKLKFKQKYYDEETGKTIEKDTETEIIGIYVDTSAKEKIEWNDREFQSDEIPLVVMTGQGVPLTITRLKKWVDESGAQEQIETQQELEKELGFSVKPGTQLQFNTVVRETGKMRAEEVSNTVTIMPALQVPGAEPRIQLNKKVTLRTPESAPHARLTQRVEKQSLTYAEFLIWARNYEVSPEHTSVAELAKAAEIESGLHENQVLVSGDAARSMMWLVKKIELPQPSGKTGKITLGNAQGDMTLSFGEFLRMAQKQGLRNYDVKEEVDQRMASLQGSDDYFPEYERETRNTANKVEKFTAQASRDGAEKQQESQALRKAIQNEQRMAADKGGHGPTLPVATAALETGAANDNKEHHGEHKEHAGGAHAEGDHHHDKKEGDDHHDKKHGDDHGKGDDHGGDDHGKEKKHDDHAGGDETMKGLKDVEVPKDGAMRAFWRKTTFLRGADIWELGKACWEYYKRWYERESKGRYANYGKDLPYLMTEMLKVKEDTEHHEVGQFKSAMVNMGVVEIQHIMHQTTNKDQLKACIEALVDKGQMDWNDMHFWQALNLHLPNDKKIRYDSNHLDPHKGVYVDPTTGKKLSGIDMVKKGIDSMWGDNQFNNWWSSNDGKYTSQMNTFDAKGMQFENDPKNNGGVRAHLQMMLRVHMEGQGGWTDPHEYEGIIRFIIKAGKASVEDKFYFIVMGVATGLLTLDRIGAINGEYLNQIPWLDWLTDKGTRKPFQEGEGPYKISELKELAGYLFHDPNIKEPGQKYLPHLRTRKLLWETVLQDDKTLVRTNKGIRQAQKIDHEDTPFIVPLVSEANAEILCKLRSSTEGMFTTEGYLNAYTGYGQFMQVTAKTGAADKLATCIKAYVRYDGILDNRYRPNEIAYQRLSISDYRRPALTDTKGIHVIQHKQQLSEMIINIGRAYGYNWEKVFQKNEKDKDKQKEIHDAINLFNTEFQEAIDNQGSQKMLDIVKNTDLYGTGEDFLTPQETQARARAAEARVAAASEAAAMAGTGTDGM
ncbi:MAG: hypothetical protein AAB551_02075 [Patescibacteria group bacterium]